MSAYLEGSEKKGGIKMKKKLGKQVWYPEDIKDLFNEFLWVHAAYGY